MEPEDLYELDSDRPDLTDSVLLQAMDGFVDAGATVKILRDHLLGLSLVPLQCRTEIDVLVKKVFDLPSLLVHPGAERTEPVCELTNILY